MFQLIQVFLQNEAPCHFALHIRQFLNLEFLNHNGSKEADHFLGLRICQISLQYIFLWRHVKTIVCATKPSSLQDLKVKIINVISGITVNQLANVFCELRSCTFLCIANDEGNVET